MNLAPNLTWGEILRGSGYDTVADLPADVRDAVESMAARMFQPLRDELGFPLTVLAGGGVRSPDMNRRVGGARTSQHMAGCALDLRGPTEAQTLRIYDVAKEMQADRRLPPGGLALYLRKDGSVRFVHVDCRGRRARWNGGARRLALA
jgi:zinc D-Ala-D-Ala carboxypeptidase|tara:strand:- start:705 stop:1148 length:444 start_codon:yes stop_codon:yes gene_type:complete